MPHLSQITFLRSILIFQQLSFLWYMDKSNKHGQETEMLSSTNSLIICCFLSQKKNSKYLHFLLEGKEDISWWYRTSSWLTDLKDNADNVEIKCIWHNKNLEFGRMHWAVTLNSKGKCTLFSVWWWFCFFPSQNMLSGLEFFLFIHPSVKFSKEILVTARLENSVFQSGWLCSLPLISP